MPSSIILDLARTPRAPGQARDALHTLPALHRSLLGDAQLLVSELVSNSVKYGGDGPVRLIVRAEDSGRVRIEVVDRGGGFVPVARDRPATEAGGWGLHLVETLTDRWGVYEGSTHVWFELSVKTPA